MASSFLFITTTNLATNPRLLRELRLAVNQGYRCTVVQFLLGNWSDTLTKKIREEFKNVSFIEISATRRPFFPWLFSTFFSEIYMRLPVRLLSESKLSVAINKRSYLLNKVLAKIDKNYDWIIAHNPGAFSPAAALAERRGSNLGIDVEDYHLGETTVLSQQKKIQAFMISTLNKAKYCSYAAPLIESFTQKLIPSFSGVSITLINSFEGIDFLLPQEAEPMTPLQLVWFSQNIDKGRGLEEVIPVINSLHKEVELHLVGNLTPSFNELYLKNKSGIVVHGPMFPQQVNLFLSRCDIGLAIDVPVNFNRQIALTNKIIAYAQAGLFIMATPTDAHRLFLESSKLEYIISDYTETSFSNCLKQLVANKEKLRKGKTERFRHGRQYDWEKKSNTLLSIWQQSKI